MVTVVPIGTDIDILEASRSGGVTYDQWLAYWDRQISICITGEALTTHGRPANPSKTSGDQNEPPQA